jgi:hypothetical protein
LQSKVCLCMLSMSLLIINAPAFAGKYRVNNSQNSIITGNNNTVNNSNNQSVSGSGNGNSRDVTVENKQVCDIVGDNNNCSNYNEQRIENRRNRRQ